MTDKKTTGNKYPAMITYIIVVLSLLAGLILPLETKTFAEGGITFADGPLMQVAGALTALGIFERLPFGAALSPTYSIEMTLFGQYLNVGAIMLLAYAFVTALALILLIPVFACRKHSPCAYKVAIASEIIVILTLGALTALQLFKVLGNYNLSVIIPLGVALLMLVIQCIVYSKKRTKEKHTAEKTATGGEYTISDFAENGTAAIETEAEVLVAPEEVSETAATPTETVDATLNGGDSVVISAEVIAASPEEVSETAACNGVTDKFIQKLNDEQKQEFLKIFIERPDGCISGIPDYVIGGDNSKFFSNVFIFLARVRDLVSDGLMNKMCEELNLIKKA